MQRGECDEGDKETDAVGDQRHWMSQSNGEAECSVVGETRKKYDLTFDIILSNLWALSLKSVWHKLHGKWA